MSTDISNNKVDSSGTTTSTPLSGGGSPSTQMSTSPTPQLSSQSATIQPGIGESSTQMAQKQTQPKAPASSGMFTNIQKYVQKNQPQAQKMSQAVQKDIGSQAADIAAQAKAKDDALKATLEANRRAMEKQKDQAEDIVKEITQRPVVETAPPATETEQPEMTEQQQEDYFKQLTGGPIGVSPVGDINLSQQSQRAQALQRLASQAQTEQGRRGLLKQTFGKESGYSGGMGALDQLILSGNQAAREGLISQAQGQAQNISQQLKDIYGTATRERLAQQKQIQDFGGDISKLAEEPLRQITGDLQTRLDQEKKFREENLPLLDKFISNYSDRLDFLKKVYGGEGYNPRGGAKATMAEFLAEANRKRPGLQYNTSRGWEDLAGKYGFLKDLGLEDYIAGGPEAFLEAARLTDRDIKALGLENVYSPFTVSGTSTYDPSFGGEINAGSRDLNNLYSAIKNIDVGANIQQELEALGATGELTPDLGLNLSSIASEEEFGKFNRLKRLLGQDITPENRRDYVTSSELRTLLDKYGLIPEVKSGGSGTGPRT